VVARRRKTEAEKQVKVSKLPHVVCGEPYCRKKLFYRPGPGAASKVLTDHYNEEHGDA
jgi:hypothetical protein